MARPRNLGRRTNSQAGRYRLIATLALASAVVTSCSVRTNSTTEVVQSDVNVSTTTPDEATEALTPGTTNEPAIPQTQATRPNSTRTQVTTTVTPEPSDPRYVVPVVDVASTSWADTHSAYPATDLFVAGGCGGGIASPADGVALEVRTVDEWDETIDNPATRGGRSIAVLGDDGVRYYLAHFDTIEPMVVVGGRVVSGQLLGTVGETGRTSACHIHFGISPPCPDKEWSVRRGVIWPYPYLEAWRAGEPLSPSDEIERWLAANPTACDDASADPFAPDS